MRKKGDLLLDLDFLKGQKIGDFSIERGEQREKRDKISSSLDD